MNPVNWHSLYLEEVYKTLDAKPEGLSQEEASRRLLKYGPNEFEEFKKKTVFGIILDQFKEVFIVILIGAGFVSLALGDASDAAIIFAVVFLNSAFGFFQEYRADETFRLLQKSLEEYAVVIRDKEQMEIPRREATPGDVVVIERGRRIPADCRLIVSHNLLVNESVLTGEWMAVKKEEGVLADGIPLPDRTNMLFMGTVAEDGSARALVVATGQDTEFGKISESVQRSYDIHTPLEKSIQRFSLYLGIFISLLVVFLFAVGVTRGIPPLQMFLSSVALAVAAVPEGLAISLTIILAIGMRRLLQRKGLVRQLFAAETLGSVSLIATDKTGTITQARMQVSHILTGSRELLRDGERIPGIRGGASGESHLLALKFVAATSEAVIENPASELEEWRIRGRPTDRALVEAALEAGIRKDELEKRGEILDTLPFDETRKFSAAILRGQDTNVLAVVGAPEIIIANSRELHIDGHVASLKSENFQKLNERYFELVQHGLRVVAVAHKNTKNHSIDHKDPGTLSGLILVGFIAMRDPIRKGIKEAIAISQAAGVKTVIVTGDHAATARAIAEEVGLKVPDGAVLEGRELEKLSDEALQKRAAETLLFARVSPEHKVRIVEAFQKNGEAVAMVGDGINDAPALKRADIGVALGSGTDIAKDAADLVLLDDSFATIVAAIREGRIIIENLRKTITFLLSGGFTEIIIVGLSIFFYLPLPLLPAQILWINLIQDSLPALALAFEKGSPGLMARFPEKKARLLERPLTLLIAFFGIIVGLSTFALFWWLHGLGSLEYARTMTMALVGASALFFIFSMKHLRSTFFGGRFFDNRFLILSVVIGFLLLVSSVNVPFLQDILGTVPLALTDWFIVITFGIFNIAVLEVLKYFFLQRMLTNHSYSSHK
ncbi:MAG: HAD-IC family P-type ATPase [Candidatus Sungiibacteriota bacterium]